MTDRDRLDRQLDMMIPHKALERTLFEKPYLKPPELPGLKMPEPPIPSITLPNVSDHNDFNRVLVRDGFKPIGE